MMAYYTGNANDFNQLKSVIENAAVLEGWFLNNEVLSKDGCYVQLLASFVKGYERIGVNGGTGQDGTLLTGTPGRHAVLSSSVNNKITWPVVYHLHVFSDEVYCIINYNVDFYQTLTFGKSCVPGIGGTGCFFGAMAADNSDFSYSSGYSDLLSIEAIGYGDVRYRGLYIGQPKNSVLAELSTPFYSSGSGSGLRAEASSFVHHGLDDGGWMADSDQFKGVSSIAALLMSGPSLFNAAHFLLPIKCVLDRLGGGQTIIQQHQHARWMRIDHVAPGEVIEYGNDRWKCYPIYSKNTAARNGGGRQRHSGTFGFAVRYDGV